MTANSYDIEKKLFIVYHFENTWILLLVPEFKGLPFIGLLTRDLVYSFLYSGSE